METCYVCYGPIESTDRFVLPDCGHVYCQSCIARYLTVSTVDGQVYPTCFYPLDNPSIRNEDVEKKDSPKCNVRISSSVIKSVFVSNNDEVSLKKYNRFLFMKENFHARECPKCDHLQIWNEKVVPIDASAHVIENERQNAYTIICDSCSYKYCYHHGGAHEGGTCEMYNQSIEKELSLSNEFIALSSKPCPGCGVLLTKSSGCNHMVCTQCNTNFCWLCGIKIEPAVFPSHFQWWTAGSCANMQMNEDINPSWRTRLYARTLSILEIVILGPITVVATVSTYVSCCCFVPSALAAQGTPESTLSEKFALLTSNCFSLWGMIFIFLLFLLPVVVIVVCIGAILGVLLLCILLPIYIIIGLIKISRGESPFNMACCQSFVGLKERFYVACCFCCNRQSTINKCCDITNGQDKNNEYINIDIAKEEVVDNVDNVKIVEENDIDIVIKD